MKKIATILLSCIIITTIAAGCSKGNEGTKKNISESNTKVITSTNTKLTEKDVKSMDDSKLMQAAVENDENLNINDLDLEEQLQGLDDILSDKDPLADIPKNISVGK